MELLTLQTQLLEQIEKLLNGHGEVEVIKEIRDLSAKILLKIAENDLKEEK